MALEQLSLQQDEEGNVDIRTINTQDGDFYLLTIKKDGTIRRNGGILDTMTDFRIGVGGRLILNT